MLRKLRNYYDLDFSSTAEAATGLLLVLAIVVAAFA